MMGIIQAYKMAIKSILGNKGRSFLTMLGVIIGVAAVISAVAFAEGSTKNVTDTIKGLGTNLIQINIMGRNSNREVTYQDLQEFASQNEDYIAYIAPVITNSGTAKFGTKTCSTSVVGTSPDYEEIKNVHVQSGRFLLSYDLDYRLKAAVVGTAVVNELFEGVDPIGQTIKIDGQIFNVVGVLQEKSGGQDQSEDDQIIIPVTVAQRMSRAAVIRNFNVQATTPEAVDGAMEKLNTFLYGVYRSESAYRVSNQAQMLEMFDSITQTMMLILGGIATVSLVVGGIGIMNIMLVSVTERTREIGIRKAIGAKRRNILIQFLIEALMVTGLGGVMGILLGLAIIRFVIGGMNLVPAVYSLPWCTISFGISLAVGVIFGIFPAYKASKLNPIEALRYE